MKNLFTLWHVMLKELSTWCGICTNLDWNTAEGRSKTEGLSFFTITLANFGADFQKSLDLGSVAPDAFAGFRRRAGLPMFLGGFLELVFDRTSGLLRDDVHPDAVFAIRQLTLSFAKISLPCTPAREAAAFDGYMSCEAELKSISWSDSDFLEFDRISQMLLGYVFYDSNRKVKNHELTPKHGPGSTADRILGNSKYIIRSWTDRLEAVFPFMEYGVPSDRHWAAMEDVQFLDPGSEVPVKVISVPKTLKTPRIIAMEPVCMQYMQQALLGCILDSYDKDVLLRRMVGFDDQHVNRDLARRGSIDGSLATLDLSEASDRVSNQLVRRLLRNYPDLDGAVDACRSRKADVPGHGVIRVAKFASMGSALCFPFEAFTFLVLVFMGIQRAQQTQITVRDIQSLSREVRVYGDDIIVPVHTATSVIETLEAFGLKVNRRKSFWNGKFRESCGGDFYDGTDVTTVRVRSVLPSSRKQAQEVISTVSLRNLLYRRGMWQTASWLDELISGVLAKYPVVHESSPVVGRFSFLPYKEEKECPNLHRPLVRGYAVASKPPISYLDGTGALLKFFLVSTGLEPVTSPDHLERAGRPQAVYLKLGWYTPF